jgi:hypothetical protein
MSYLYLSDSSFVVYFKGSSIIQCLNVISSLDSLLHPFPYVVLTLPLLHLLIFSYTNESQIYFISSYSSTELQIHLYKCLPGFLLACIGGFSKWTHPKWNFCWLLQTNLLPGFLWNHYSLSYMPSLQFISKSYQVNLQGISSIHSLLTTAITSAWATFTSYVHPTQAPHQSWLQKCLFHNVFYASPRETLQRGNCCMWVAYPAQTSFHGLPGLLGHTANAWKC